MSIEQIQRRLQHFISSTEPAVFCLKGKWGVGKTFAWNESWRKARKEKSLLFPSYAYVSLFGIDDLANLKAAIFGELKKNEEIENGQSSNDSYSGFIGRKYRSWRKIIEQARNSPFISNFTGPLHELIFALVTNATICIDDIERRSKNLDIKDVLGLASLLKNEKKCKVILILNDEALAESSSEFKRYFEKVVDISVELSPTPTECAQLGISLETKHSEFLKEKCIDLKITNIRLIYKICTLAKQLFPEIESRDENIIKNTIASLVLFSWCLFSPDDAPSIEFIKSHRLAHNYGLKSASELNETEKRFNLILDDFGFGHMDELDVLIADGIKVGYFELSAMKEIWAQQDQDTKAKKSLDAYGDAWDIYHDSFDDNEDEVIKTIRDAFLENISRFSPANLDGTVRLFRELGRNDLAEEALNAFLAQPERKKEFFDLTNYSFSSEVRDDMVKQRLKEKTESFFDARSPREVILEIVEKSGWNPEDIQLLAKLEVNDFYELFKATRGDALGKIVRRCIEFGNYSNPEPNYLKIASGAKDALKRIASESRLNQMRVRKYGVEVE